MRPRALISGLAALVVATSAPPRHAFGQTPPATVEADASEEEKTQPQRASRPSLDGGTLLTAEALASLPRPTDPWSVLRDVPGVVVDRVNVGGSETAQQSLLVSHGDTGPGAVWTLDGIDITDPASLGFTTIYPDMDALAAVEARTSALDVRVRTPGVQVGLLLPGRPERFSGVLHLRGAGDALQSDNLPTALRTRPFLRNRTDRILELGGQAGGTVKKERLWIWGALSRSSLRQQTFTEHAESLWTSSLTAKAGLRLGSGVFSILALRAEKIHEDRDTGLSAAPEARWRQSGPAHLVAAEDRRNWGGVSLLSRISYVDAGFRLDPPGGASSNVFQDFRGVLRGSYYTFDTDRSRVQAGVEATGRRRWLGLDHELLAGAGYRRMPVATRLAWPGNKVLAIERQSVFFRAFRLTGFALPLRDENARSVHDEAEAYVQDTVRMGRLSAGVGFRLDRLAGRNRASSVAANPVFPELLPAVAYTGEDSRFRWLDLLPRAGVAWDVRGDGSLVARTSYAAYGAPLGAGEIAFDNPLVVDASLAYFWRDLNGDHAVEAGELDLPRGLVASSGLDPADPASPTSPNVVDPALRSPRTHEAAISLEEFFGRNLAAAIHVSLRRTGRILWTPLSNLALGDYVARGRVVGRLFGEEYAVTYFAPAAESKIVPGDGRRLANRPAYHRESVTVEATLRGQVGEGVSWRAWGALMDHREYFEDFRRSIQDPTPLDTDPLQDAGRVAVRAAGLGRGDVFVNARWAAGAWLQASLPWRFHAAVLAHARDGFPIPYFEVANTGDPTDGAKSVLVAPRVDSFRLAPLVLVDARLDRALRVGAGTLTVLLDAFNLLDRGTTLQVARDIELPAFSRPREIMRPRILRLGVEYRF